MKNIKKWLYAISVLAMVALGAYSCGDPKGSVRNITINGGSV